MSLLFTVIRLPQPERKHIFSVVIRSINCCIVRFREDDFRRAGNPKTKIIVVKKKMDPVHGNKILEWKTASSVIRRLNWENKSLFGPIQNSKPNTNIEKILETNQIIQHKTQIPIIEPNIQHQNSEEKHNETCSSPQTSHLSKILTFPLENKLIPSFNKVNELNHLRKHLQSLTKGSMPSVSTILQKTMPKERVRILDMWKKNMIAKLGEEGFERYHKALLENGKSLHDNISSFLSSTPESDLIIKEENIGHWNSLKKVLSNVKDVKLLEEFVTHPFLCYRGVVDCFAQYRDQLVVIDWKTSKKSKAQIKDVYDNPLQIAAYVGALNFDPKFQYLAQKGLIVIAYESGNPATVHFLDKVSMKHYWNEWLKRVKQFWEIESE